MVVVYGGVKKVFFTAHYDSYIHERSIYSLRIC
ncbi:hypothetical protein ANME2D_03123 [Candidatus Methanoperedens nitroreducens]|uniref:Uncharacterized protein n=1 Tax=Candidatus Methanoperedens nitratireducens TaxID=1392998 RepID=A0A062UVP2_9EURY|nr:hypothetical protein ANME2D_03123 [Candidatus Methanoperedens nitroreducens]